MIKNQVKTILFLGILTAILLWIGSFFGQGGLLIGLIFALVINIGSYWFSDKIVLKMYRAKPASKEQHADLYRMVKELTKKANLPMPKLYIVPSQSPNAFATGRNPEHAAVACTQGILNLLNKEQLRGVLAHEISHVKNRDILITTIAAVVAGIISYAAMMARWAAIFGGMGRDRNGGSMFEMLALAILAPIIALIIRLAISRSREYLADETGAKMIGEGEPLATALEALHSNVGHNPMRLGNETTSSLFIVNPFSAKGLTNLFSTHPPMTERTKRLRNMKF